MFSQCFFVYALTPSEVYKNVSESIVLVKASRNKTIAIGSGVVIKNDQVVTNCHVIRKSDNVFIKGKDKWLNAQVIKGDKSIDLCVLSVPKLNGEPVVISKKNLEIGEQVFAIGNPEGLEKTLSEGLVSSFRKFAKNVNAIQITAPITFGSSGGGLFDAMGHLVGITTMGLPNGNLNFAMPIAYLDILPIVNSGNITNKKDTEILDGIKIPISLAVRLHDIGKSSQINIKFQNSNEKIEYDIFFRKSEKLIKNHNPSPSDMEWLINAVWYESHRAGIEPSLTMGLIDELSQFNQFQASNKGRRGLLAVPVDIFEFLELDSDPVILFDARVNLRAGLTIVRYLVDKNNGDIYEALSIYGSKISKNFPDKVRNKWKLYE